MYIWILMAIAVGVTVLVLFAVLFAMLSFSTKSWIANGKPTKETTRNKTAREGQNVVITDPFSGKLMNLERVSNASSLRSTKSIGFIAYDNADSRSSRGRVAPLFHTGSIKSVRSNKSVASSSAASINQEMKNVNVNPLFKEECESNEPGLSKSTQMRARGLIFEK